MYSKMITRMELFQLTWTSKFVLSVFFCWRSIKSIQSITLPSIWNINAGSRSKLHLDPFDPDGDRIQCSWTPDKNEPANPAFHLDQSECIINYDPALDHSEDENSIMKIEIQDFRENATDYSSSIPVQFITNILKHNESQIPELQNSRLGSYNQIRLLA